MSVAAVADAVAAALELDRVDREDAGPCVREFLLPLRILVGICL